MNIIKNILNVISDISNNKYTEDNSIQIGDWIIIDTNLYNKYKNKITIKHISYTDNAVIGNVGDYEVNDTRITFDTKEGYGYLKYNTNFIAFVLYDREYELLTKPIHLIAINKNLSNNFEQKINQPPTLQQITKILNWKISKKALQEFKNNLE